MERNFYLRMLDHEVDSTRKMLRWLDTVPAENRNDPRYQQALTLAGHLAAARENWMDRIRSDGQAQVNWFPARQDRESLEARFAAIFAGWRLLLEESDLSQDFEYQFGSKRMRWNVEEQAIQMLTHAPYHRGQIALLVDQLGGKTTDTDYLFWRREQEKRWGEIG